jgi:hypothetical protein
MDFLGGNYDPNKPAEDDMNLNFETKDVVGGGDADDADDAQMLKDLGGDGPPAESKGDATENVDMSNPNALAAALAAQREKLKAKAAAAAAAPAETSGGGDATENVDMSNPNALAAALAA